MEDIDDIHILKDLETKGALFILFGGASCNICNNIRPQLTEILEEHFPEMHGVYVDCENSPEICAQYGVFGLPVVKAYIEGMLIAEDESLRVPSTRK